MREQTATCGVCQKVFLRCMECAALLAHVLTTALPCCSTLTTCHGLDGAELTRVVMADHVALPEHDMCWGGRLAAQWNELIFKAMADTSVSLVCQRGRQQVLTYQATPSSKHVTGRAGTLKVCHDDQYQSHQPHCRPAEHDTLSKT